MSIIDPHVDGVDGFAGHVVRLHGGNMELGGLQDELHQAVEEIGRGTGLAAEMQRVEGILEGITNVIDQSDTLIVENVDWLGPARRLGEFAAGPARCLFIPRTNIVSIVGRPAPATARGAYNPMLDLKVRSNDRDVNGTRTVIGPNLEWREEEVEGRWHSLPLLSVKIWEISR